MTVALKSLNTLTPHFELRTWTPHIMHVFGRKVR